MSNKSKRKNTRQVAKQKRRRTPSNLSLAVPSQPLPPDFKISEAILTLAEPLRMQYREPHRMQAIISIAVMAWNISHSIGFSGKRRGGGCWEQLNP